MSVSDTRLYFFLSSISFVKTHTKHHQRMRQPSTSQHYMESMKYPKYIPEIGVQGIGCVRCV